MAASKGVLVLVMAVAAQFLLMPLTVMAADPIRDTISSLSQMDPQVAAATQVQTVTNLLPERELGNCGPAFGTCRTRPCCDENFGCSYTERKGVVIAATCRPLGTCNSAGCTLDQKNLPPLP
jgi:hypothetical protein